MINIIQAIFKPKKKAIDNREDFRSINGKLS